jgi:Ca2+-transporting ATPase
MSTLHQDAEGGYLSYTKGAVEVILERSRDMATSSGPIAFDIRGIGAVSEQMAADGLRVLGVGMRRWATLPSDISPAVIERDLTLLGLIGLVDSPRGEAHEAVEMCKSGGIIPVMITGDHPMTARAVARRLGILGEGGAALTGAELAMLSAEELRARVEEIRVYARVAPEQKLNIVTALQDRGEIVAMTGDGVNDAPALRRADIGVAMGVTGTDVAKEASAMVLLDDNFATIVRAIREGRCIYDNIRRFIRYAVTTNSGEIGTMFLAPILGLPVSLLPIQIL